MQNVVAFILNTKCDEDIEEELKNVFRHSIEEIPPYKEMTNSQICEAVKSRIWHHLGMSDVGNLVDYVIVYEKIEDLNDVYDLPPIAGADRDEVCIIGFPYAERVIDPKFRGKEITPEWRTIRVSMDTYKALAKMGTTEETFDEVLQRVLKEKKREEFHFRNIIAFKLREPDDAAKDMLNNLFAMSLKNIMKDIKPLSLSNRELCEYVKREMMEIIDAYNYLRNVVDNVVVYYGIPYTTSIYNLPPLIGVDRDHIHFIEFPYVEGIIDPPIGGFNHNLLGIGVLLSSLFILYSLRKL